MRTFETPFSWSESENSRLVLKHRARRGVINVPPLGDLTQCVMLLKGDIGDGRGYFVFFNQTKYKYRRAGSQPDSVRCSMQRITMITPRARGLALKQSQASVVLQGQNNGKDWSVAIESGEALTTRRRPIYRMQSGLIVVPRKVSVTAPAN